MAEQRVTRLPDFIGVGPPRTATTWLHRVLAGRVGLPSGRKETDFFSRNFERGLDWYLDYFRECPRDLPMGEFSPMYFADRRACDRIAELIPRCRIIVSFRDPVERAWSQWRLMVRQAWTRLDFAAAVARHHELRESGRYGHYLASWIERFGLENVLVLIYEDLEADPQAFLDRVCGFIGVARFNLDDSPVGNQRVHTVPVAPRSYRLARNARKVMRFLNERQYHRTARRLAETSLWRFCFEGGAPFPPPTPEDDARVREMFRPEVEHLERIIGRDLSAWTARRGASQDNSAGAVSRAGA
jgi:Sulfotransferase family